MAGSSSQDAATHLCIATTLNWQRLPSKYHPGTFAFHSDDIEYVFGTLDTRPGLNVRPEDRQLSEAMMSYWTNFAKTGDPNGSGVPNWPKYGADDSLIHLNSPITSGPDTTRARYEFLLGDSADALLAAKPMAAARRTARGRSFYVLSSVTSSQLELHSLPVHSRSRAESCGLPRGNAACWLRIAE